MRLLSATLAASMMLSAPVSAATVASQSGQLLINSGDGFKVAGGATEVAPGGQIMVRDGTARIAYSSECSVLVGPGRVWTVAAAAPCKGGVSTLDMTTVSYQGGPGSTGSAGGPPVDHLLLIGGAVAGAGVGIYFLTRDDDDNRAAASSQ